MLLFKNQRKLGVVVFTCNTSTQEAEAGRSEVLGQPGLHKETLSQTKQNKKEEKKSPLSLMFFGSRNLFSAVRGQKLII
jgi:hypothetical protein